MAWSRRLFCSSSSFSGDGGRGHIVWCGQVLLGGLCGEHLYVNNVPSCTLHYYIFAVTVCLLLILVLFPVNFCFLNW